MNQLEYWFDAEKVANKSTNTVKTWFKELMVYQVSSGFKLTPTGEDWFETIQNNNTGGANNTGLRGSLFPRGEYPDEYDDDQYKDAAKTTFQRLINTLDNKLFGFVKVK